MPHVIVKMYPGRSEDAKKKLAEAVNRVVQEILEVPDRAVSIDIEEVPPEEWPEKVYRPFIRERLDRLYKKPGYDPFST